jgi:fructose-1,6-bisphosphatase
MADNNNYWLEQILNGNDMVLSKNIVDYEENRKDILQSQIGRQLQHKLNELTKTNSILKHRLEYAEWVMKKLPTKLI